MTIVPIKPTPPPLVPKTEPGPFKSKATFYERMRQAFFPVEHPEVAPKGLAQIKAEAFSIEGTAEQEKDLRDSLVRYLHFLLRDDAGQVEILEYVAQIQDLSLNLFNVPLQKENIPKILAHLVAHPKEQSGELFGRLIPLTKGGKLTLHLTNSVDQGIHEQIESKEKWAIVRSLETLHTLYYQTFKPEEVEVSLDQVKGLFDTRENYIQFLEGWFARELKLQPNIEKDMLAVLTPVKFDPLSPTPPNTILTALVEIMVPKVIDRVLATLSKANLTTVVDHSAKALKLHLDQVRKTESRLKDLQHEIVWLRKGLIQGSISAQQELRNFSIKVWGQDLFNLSVAEREKFFSQPSSTNKEEHYLKEAQYQFLGIKQPTFDKAFLAEAIPEDQVVLAGYKKTLQKEMAHSVSVVLGSYIGSLITPDLLKEVIVELNHAPNTQWDILEGALPPLRQLRLQLQTGAAGPDDLIDFLPFLKEDLPGIIKGAIQFVLEQKMVSDILTVPWIHQLIEKTLLPTAVDCLYGLMVSDSVEQHQHLLIEALVDPNQEPHLIAQVKFDFESLMKEENLTAPQGFDVDQIVHDSLQSLRSRMKELYGNADDSELRSAIVEFLKPVPPAPGEDRPIYTELVLAALFDLVGLPPYLKRFAESLPGFPAVSSKLSMLITSSVAPFREGHGELVRVLTSLFDEMIQPKIDKKKPVTETRPPEVIVDQISKLSMVLFKQKTGIKKWAPVKVVQLLSKAEPYISSLITRVLKHPLIRDPLYHHKVVVLLTGGAS